MKRSDEIMVSKSNRDRSGDDARRRRGSSTEGRNPDLRVFSGSLEAALWLPGSDGRFRINRWWEQEDEERFTPNLKSPDVLQLPHLCAELAYYHLYFDWIGDELRQKLVKFLPVVELMCSIMQHNGVSRHVPRIPVGEIPVPSEVETASATGTHGQRPARRGKR